MKDSGMSHQAVYSFAFKRWYIPAMKNLKDQIGQDRFLEMLKSLRKICINPVAMRILTMLREP
jgi:hypothetical protein